MSPRVLQSAKHLIENSTGCRSKFGVRKAESIAKKVVRFN
jgi:hypothetical protein